ncbi:hypothetical protein GGF40_003708 [Coemansia sp. RSA 1286]|nr:hypothetical protein GGF40_003708 [Coemansia sp. RSA 1286]
MTIPIYKFNPALSSRSASRFGTETESSISPGSYTYAYNTGESVINDYAGNFEGRWDDSDNDRTYINHQRNYRGRSAAPSFIEPAAAIATKSAGQTVDANGSHDTIALHIQEQEKGASEQLRPLAKNIIIFFKTLRIVHALAGLTLLACVCGMQVYMLLGKINILVIPLFACRLFLMAFLVVLVLCDLNIPRKVHDHFPMYNNKRSWKWLGLSQLIVAFFILGDSTLSTMEQSRESSAFARVLFPMVLSFSSLMIAVGLTYFIAGAVGGAKLKRRFLE